MISGNTVRRIFTCLCVVTVIGMVAFWCHKFWIDDREIGVVDYVPFMESGDFEHPVASLCIENPFKAAKFLETKTKINEENYLMYLRGDVSNLNFSEIDYGDVTVDLSKYFLFGVAERLDGLEYEELSVRHTENYNGFVENEILIKCYEITLERKNSQPVNKVMFVYDRQRLLFDMGKESFWLAFAIHYPGQLLLATNGLEYLNIKNDSSMLINTIRDVEILQSRNSRKRKCTNPDEMTTFDDMVEQEHIKYNGCTPPYFKPIGELQICHNKGKIKASLYNYPSIWKKYIPISCQRISQISIDSPSGYAVELDWSEYVNIKKPWTFSMTYPEYIRIISQSKDVDIHALIGNIGGYVGLFLGNQSLQL